MKKIILLLVIIASIGCGGNALKELKGLWLTRPAVFKELFFSKDIKGNYCIEIKLEEKKAYFYLDKSDNLIAVTELIKIDEQEFAFVYKGNKIFFTWDTDYESKQIVKDQLVVQEKINKKVSEGNDRSLNTIKSLKQLNKMQENLHAPFPQTPKGCFDQIKWEKEYYSKLGDVPAVEGKKAK